MNYRRLGQAGIKIGEISLGTWVTFVDQISEDTVYACMKAAYAAGVNFFDNAEGYANGEAELLMGRVLKKAGWRRESLVISTKIFWGGDGPNDVGLSRKHIIEGVNNSLRRLQLDYVDLVYCHRLDPNTPMEETVRAMDLVIRQGKALYWGTSKWCAADIIRADELARQYSLTPPTMEQPPYNMVTREWVEKEYLPLYSGLGYGITAFSPLATGILTGKYNDGIPAGSRLSLSRDEWLHDPLMHEKVEKVKKLQPLVAELGCTSAQLALAWCLVNPHVSTVITGTSHPEQVVENIKALEVVPRLTPEVLERIDKILESKPEQEMKFHGCRALLGMPSSSVAISPTLEQMAFCFIPAGPFVMGEGTEKHTNPALAAGFWLARYPVTNALVAHFVESGGYAEQRYWPEAEAAKVWRRGMVKGWNDDKPRNRPHDFGAPFNLPDHPAVGVTWYEALAFCRWLNEQFQAQLPRGYSIELPSEAEWEKASRGGERIPHSPLVHELGAGLPLPDRLDEQVNPEPERLYPWGCEFDANLANIDETQMGATSAVGYFPGGASPYGVLDLSGNVWEWCKSKYRPYPYDPNDGREELDGSGQSRVLRGGAFRDARRAASCVFRYPYYPDPRSNRIGFRVAVVLGVSRGSCP